MTVTMPVLIRSMKLGVASDLSVIDHIYVGRKLATRPVFAAVGRDTDRPQRLVDDDAVLVRPGTCVLGLPPEAVS